MESHTHAPSIRLHGLADGCRRCTELAADPVSGLDDSNLRALIERTLAWMRDEEFPRSETEALAMRKIEELVRFLRVVGRLGIYELQPVL